MNKIIEKEKLSERVVKMVLEAPIIAQKRKAGQFIVLKINEKGERIPLTIVDSDAQKGTITIIFQIVGKTTAQLEALKIGDTLQDIVGPLGNPTEIENYGRVVCIGGGVGIHWPDLGEDISVESLLAGRRSGETQASLRRWLKARKAG